MPNQYVSLNPKTRFWSYVQKGKGCWIWLGGRTSRKRRDGKSSYGGFWFKGRTVPAHKWAWEATYGPVPDGLLVLHHCDNPPCVRPDHLFVGTNTDNMRDAAVKQRTASGVRHGMALRARATPEVVGAMIVARQHGQRYSDIARDFGFHSSYISRVTNGLRRTSVSEAL